MLLLEGNIWKIELWVVQAPTGMTCPVSYCIAFLKDCVKYRAMKSIQCVKNVSEEDAKKAVDDVFEQCFRDTIPFERVPP